MEMLGIQVVIWAACGVIAAAIASSKGRNVVAWFFGGALLQCIGIIIVACLSNLKQEAAYRQHAEHERHRLREQLRQERLKAEALRRYSMARLDAHDNALGMDTRSIEALPGAQPVDQLPQHAGPGDGRLLPGAATSQSPIWYYEHSGEVMGPTTEADIAGMLQREQITPETLVWAEGLPDWKPLSETLPDAQSDAQQAGRTAPALGQPRREGLPPPSAASSSQPAVWYYEHGGEVKGPATEADIVQMLGRRQLSAQSLVWSEALSDWTPLAQVERFRPATGV